MWSRRVPPLTALLCAGLLAGCGGPTTAADPEEPTQTPQEDAAEVIVSFYPLQFVAERIAGDRAVVTNLTPPGAEPHDLELAPRDVAALTEADLFVYLRGLQPAVDDAVDSIGVPAAFDVTDIANLSIVPEDAATSTGEPSATGEATDGQAASEEGHSEDEGQAAVEGHEEEEEEEGHEEHTGPDPHFWLDPLRLAAVADAVAQRLAESDPADAAHYQDSAAQLRAELEALDAEMTAGLASCTNRTLVTSHESFGYLAERYGFEQLGIHGLNPEDEPDPAELAEVTDFVRARGVTTVYFETLISPDLATTVAQETGATTAVLDPLEGLTEESPGTDYLEVMRANLATLQAGQSCA